MTAPTIVFRPRICVDQLYQLQLFEYMYNSLRCTICTMYNSVLPGTIATVLSARNTLNVLKAARLPKSIPMVT